MKKFYIFLALCLMSVMNVRAEEVTVYDGTQKNVWAPFALSYGNGWTESQYVIPASALSGLNGKIISGVKYYCDATSAFTSSVSVNFFMWEEAASVTSLSSFRPTKTGYVAYSGTVSFVKKNGVCETTITFNNPLTYEGGSLIFYNYSNPAGKNNVSFYGKTVSGACWAGNNEEMGGVMANVGQRNFAPKTTFICENAPAELYVAYSKSIHEAGYFYDTNKKAYEKMNDMVVESLPFSQEHVSTLMYSYGGEVETITFDPSFHDAPLTDFTNILYQYLPYNGRSEFCYYNATAVNGLENINTANMTSMASMFRGLQNVMELDLSSFNTSNVTSMTRMFSLCKSLLYVDLMKFDFRKLEKSDEMFYDCESLNTIYCKQDFNELPSLTFSLQMFDWCTSLMGESGTTYSRSYTDKAYARPDLPGQPGYFTNHGLGIESIQHSAGSLQKVIRNGQLLIERNGKTFTITGQPIR